MSKYIDELAEKFIEIKNKGWIEAHRKGDTAIGKTFEDLLGKDEDNKSLPDYKDIEIKSQDKDTGSMLSLFTLAPKPSAINTKLRENFGIIDDVVPTQKVLHTTISAKEFNTHRGGHDFKVDISDEEKKVYISIKDHSSGTIVNKEAFWDFEDIQKALEKKLKYIAYVNADKKVEEGKTYFYYNEMYIITGLSMDNFLKALKNGDIKIDIRIGIYRNPDKSNYGQTHDHGTGFRIIFNDLKKYANIKKIASKE